MTAATFNWPSVLGALVRREDLGTQLASHAMREILTGAATEAQIAAFALGLRMKGETVDEVDGLVRVMLEAAVPLRLDGPLLDTCGTGGDRSGTFNVSTLAALVVAGVGHRVVKHGNRAASSSCGSADILEALGVAIDLPPQDVAVTVEEVGIGFCFAPVFHPAMRHAAAPRRQLGVPTIFNLLGPLTNPARVGYQVLGVADAHMAPIVAEVLRRTGIQHAWVVHGDDGLDELTTTTTTRVLDVRPGSVRELVVDPSALGLIPATREELLGGDVNRNVAIARSVLDGEGGAPRDMVLLNAAAALVAGDVAVSLPEGLELAARSIDDGLARGVLHTWVQTSQRLARQPRQA